MITGCSVHFVGKTGKHHLAIIEQEYKRGHTVSADLIVFVRELKGIKFLDQVPFDQDDKPKGTWHWIEDFAIPPTAAELVSTIPSEA